MKYPKISIITPSYNQGQFIERTIISVLNQKYPNLEYIVMDGGSTDNTINILKRYSGKIIWKSEIDKGQTHAINKGLKMATGDILAYLNSDDTYEPKTFDTISEFFKKHPNEKFVYGNGRLIDTQDRKIGLYNTLPEDSTRLFASCGISQPTAFWKKELLDSVGYFDESFRFTMDYEYWVRAAKLYKLNFIPNILASTRIHKDAKTSEFTHQLHSEAIRVSLMHYGKVHYDWIFTFVDSAYKNKKNTPAYFRYMILHSLFFFWRYNHALPPAKGLKIIGSWMKHTI